MATAQGPAIIVTDRGCGALQRKRPSVSTAMDGSGGRMKYQIYGLTLESNVRLPGLTPSREAAPPQIVFELWPAQEGGQSALPADSLAFDLPQRDGAPFIEVYHLWSYYVIRFPASLDFLISPDGSLITCRVYGEVSLEYVRVILLGWVFSLILHLYGMGGLHAGAIVVGNGAIGLVGPSGAGKSTLSAAAAFLGYPVLADEVLAFRHVGKRIYAFPGYQEVRVAQATAARLVQLFQGATTARPDTDDKVSLVCPAAPRALPLRGLYVLSRSDQPAAEGVCIRPLDPRDAPRELLGHSFVIPRCYPKLLDHQLDMLCSLCSRVPVKRLVIPSALDRLPEVVEALLQDCEAERLLLEGSIQPASVQETVRV